MVCVGGMCTHYEQHAAGAEMRRADGDLLLPRPGRPSQEQCYNAWDCQAIGEYCYEGEDGIYCRFDDSGEGSVCQSDTDCGYLPDGVTQLFCDGGYCELSGNEPLMGRRLDDGTGCMTNSDCTDGLVCQHNICVHREGCSTDSNCPTGRVCEHNICVEPLMDSVAKSRRLDACPTSSGALGSTCSQPGLACKIPNKTCTGGFELARCQASGKWAVAC